MDSVELVSVALPLHTGPSPGSVVVSGILLEGAEWDDATCALRVPTQSSLYTALPPLVLVPRKRQCQPHAPSSVQARGRYQCPLYKTTARAGTLSTSGHSSNFLAWLPLPSGYPECWRRALRSEASYAEGGWVDDCPEWIRAGVAAFLSSPL